MASAEGSQGAEKRVQEKLKCRSGVWSSHHPSCFRFSRQAAPPCRASVFKPQLLQRPKGRREICLSHFGRESGPEVCGTSARGADPDFPRPGSEPTVSCWHAAPPHPPPPSAAANHVRCERLAEGARLGALAWSRLPRQPQLFKGDPATPRNQKIPTCRSGVTGRLYIPNSPYPLESRGGPGSRGRRASPDGRSV